MNYVDSDNMSQDVNGLIVEIPFVDEAVGDWSNSDVIGRQWS